MTELLYLKDSYTEDFEATVTMVQGRNVVLDKTLFYPESGGQPDDRGKLVRMPDGKNFMIRGVKKLGAEIIHEVDEDGLRLGDKIHGWVDMDRRHRFMRMHTACHILSSRTGVLTTGKQIDLDKSRIDFELENFNADLAKQFIEKANLITGQDIPVKTSFMSYDEVMKNPEMIRLKYKLPPSIPQLRIVSIEGVDMQPCGGTHVKSTKEVGQLEFIGVENKGKDKKRIYFTLK
jgi:Ser-tRNA(Ala) deacylase AlaX